MSRAHFLPLFGFALVVGLAGCSSSAIDGTRLGPVAGRVVQKGTPVTRGTVSFRPNAAKGNLSKHEPSAEIDSSGYYRLKTQGRDGAPLGWYRVILSCAEPIDPKNPYAPPKFLVNPKYATLETSDLAIEVVNGAPAGAYDLLVSP